MSTKSLGIGMPYIKFTAQESTSSEQSSTSISDFDLAFPTPVFRAVSKYLDLWIVGVSVKSLLREVLKKTSQVKAVRGRGPREVCPDTHFLPNLLFEYFP